MEIKDNKEDYDLIAKEIPGFAERFSYDDFTKAKWLVTSRNFGVDIKGVEE